MPLTDTAIRNAKPGEKPVKLFDGGGLYRHLSSASSRLHPPRHVPAGCFKRHDCTVAIPTATEYIGIA